ncbi:hypothetical protein [uncultured Gilvimarinus sp.]|uniref:hypothetical protein n=1 Tax=uncultured Gilvimarinus sp. TaxID=1689143 RepID=UPI0030D8AF45
MINRWLINVLALVIVLQSAVAIGGAIHADHSEALQHQHTHTQHEHSHELGAADKSVQESEPSSITSNPSQDHPADHCHHTHAQLQITLIGEQMDITVLANSELLSDYKASHTSISLPSLLRPPIA